MISNWFYNDLRICIEKEHRATSKSCSHEWFHEYKRRMFAAEYFHAYNEGLQNNLAFGHDLHKIF